MPWSRIDMNLPDHKKVLRAGKLRPLAIALHVSAICYSNRHLTDGRIDDGIVGALTYDFDALAGEKIEWPAVMIALELWERIPDGYLVHDFLDYNPSADEVSKLQKKKARAGRRGAMAKWKQNDGTLPGFCHNEGMAKRWQGDGKIMPPNPNPNPKDHPPPSPPDRCADCLEVVSALEKITGVVVTRWTPQGIVEKVHARHQEHTKAKCLEVVEVVAPRLMASEEFKRFARIDTLFGPKTFLKYLEEVALARARTHRGRGDTAERFERGDPHRCTWQKLDGKRCEGRSESEWGVCEDCRPAFDAAMARLEKTRLEERGHG